MRQIAIALGLLVFAGCPDTTSKEAVDPVAERKAQVELDTRLAEGGEALEVEEAPPGK